MTVRITHPYAEGTLPAGLSKPETWRGTPVRQILDNVWTWRPVPDWFQRSSRNQQPCQRRIDNTTGDALSGSEARPVRDARNPGTCPCMSTGHATQNGTLMIPSRSRPNPIRRARVDPTPIHHGHTLGMAEVRGFGTGSRR